MKARLETGGASGRGLGIVIESENEEEECRLTDLWCADGRCCVFEREGSMIIVTVAPMETKSG